jgi:hypothetical protein
LPASPTPTMFCNVSGVGGCGSSAFFEIDGVSFSLNGVLQTGGEFVFFPLVNSGGFELGMFGQNVPLLDEAGPLLYMGSEGSPTFVPGTYGGFTTASPAGTLDIPGLTGVLTITSIPGGGDLFTYDLTSVPEPASLLLLGTGIVGLIGFARKKILG